MKQLRLVCAAVLVASLGAYAVSSACEKNKSTATAAAASKTSARTAAHSADMAKGCTAEMAKSCTAEMAAACAARKGTSATAALNGGAMSGCCEGKDAKLKASTTSATMAPIGKVNALAVGSDGGSCSAHGKTTAMAAGSSCSAHGSMASGAHGDCEGCADFAMCENEVKLNGAAVQIVPLKNGVMYVYTADAPARVQAVQSAMSRRSERFSAILASGDKAHLCPECKSVRGAMASGKMSREVVNIEGGCLTLVTSSDAATIAKLHAMAGVKAPSRFKL